MDELIKAITCAKTGDEIEVAISSSSVLDLFECFEKDKTSKQTLQNTLEKIFDNDKIETTAKLRRRIKRFQQSLDVVTTRASIQQNIDTRNTPTNPTFTRAPVIVVQHLTPGDSITALSSCNSYFDLEREMNNLYLPTEEQGGLKGTFFAEFRVPMKEILQQLVVKDRMTNKLLRRRVTRLIFNLSTDAEQAQEVAAVKAKAAMASVRNLTAKRPSALKKTDRSDYESNQTSHTSNTQAPVAIIPTLSKFEQAKCIADCISGIRSATKPSDVERVISALPSSGFGDSELLRGLLNDILDNEELVNNAKLRRRVKRLIETLQASSATAVSAVIGNIDGNINSNTDNNNENKTMIKEVPVTTHPIVTSSSSSSSALKTKKLKPPVSKVIAAVIENKKLISLKIPLVIPSTLPIPIPPVSTVPVRIITGSFNVSLNKLLVCNNATEVEEALADLSIESEGSEGEKLKLRFKLLELFKNEDLINNSKLRRRVKRLIDVLEPLDSNSSSSNAENRNDVKPNNITNSDNANDEHVIKEKKKRIKKKKVKIDTKNPPAGPPLEDLISQINSIKSGAVLCEMLETEKVDKDSGSCVSRRTLKRSLERVMKEDSGVGDMTDNTRRKIRRIADMLAPQPR